MLAQQISVEALVRMLTMYADDSLLQTDFESPEELQTALGICNPLLDQLVELGFKFNPSKSALLIQLRGGSAQIIRNKLVKQEDGIKYVELPPVD